MSGRPLRWRWRAYWPGLVAFLFPVVFVPVGIVDAYILPRVALLLVAIAAGLALARTAELRAAMRGLWLPAAAVVLAAVAADLFSISPWVGLAGGYLRYESLVTRVAYLLLLVVTAALLAGPGEEASAARRRTVSCFLAGCAIAGLEAAYQWLALRYGWPGGLDRPDGNLGNAGLLGVLEAMATAIAFGRVVARGGLRWAPLLVPILAGLAASTSRSAWLAALLAVMIVAAFRLPARHRLPAAAGAVVATAAALFVVLGPLGHLNSDPSAVRLEVWRRVLPMIEARPIFGWGEETFALVFGRYAHGYLPGVQFDRAHDQLLDLAQSQGLAGVIAGAWFWLAVARRVFRAELAPILAALAAYWTWAALNFDWAPATGPMWLLAGVAWAATVPTPAESSAAEVRAMRWGAATLAASAALVFGLLPLAADAASHSRDYERAVALDPLQARYHQLLGMRLAQAGRVRQARDELRRAGDLGDSDPNLWVDLSQVDARLGNAAAAAADLARARQIDPAAH